MPETYRFVMDYKYQEIYTVVFEIYVLCIGFQNRFLSVNTNSGVTALCNRVQCMERNYCKIN
jgi:hypothetical protein